ncbi:DUF5684 domain-containing protein [Saccharicrinis aurantiacus]|uniref:DUF5684 domain-containing protein n=1 Tax=Saccharicrinis aurantiacus TaxID=1849719 RepID=UPI0024923391|nr:DUF5684 domain-containing protein [Saccharicrinis aurantiacus]
METMDYGDSAGLFAGLGVGVIIISLLVSLILIAAQWKTFTKAEKPGWACIVPIYQIIILLEIVGKPAWWILLLIFPLTSPIIAIWMINLLSKSFGKGIGFTLGLIFLGPIFWLILGFGNSEYQGPAGAPAPIAA